jgi:hypothetical protein
MLINEAKRLQQLAGLTEKQGYYLTPTEDPETSQLHITTDEKPALSKSYEPLSPKSQRKDGMSSLGIERVLTSTLRNNGMDYDAAIASISHKYKLNAEKLKQDFPKVDILHKAPLDEINQVVNEALEKFRTDEAEAAQTDPAAEKDAEQGLKQALAVLKSGASTVKPSPQDGQIDEALGLTLGLIAGAPGLISLLGKTVNTVSSVFQKDKKKGTVVGNALKHFGHDLEGYYLGAIGEVLKKAFPKLYGQQDVKDHTSELYKAAHWVYASILAVAAIGSGLGAAQAHSTTAVGLEGGLSAFKSSEVLALAQKIAPAAVAAAEV